MFTNKKAKYYGDNKVLLDSACLSSDTKPTTGVANGSKLLEMDTSTVYAFDEANGEWLAQSSSGGGGGGGGTEPLIVNIVNNTEQTRLVLDKTWNEIKTAVTNGQVVWTLTEDVDYEDKYEAVAVIEHAITDGKYGVAVGYNSYGCDSADDYPYYYYGD